MLIGSVSYRPPVQRQPFWRLLPHQRVKPNFRWLPIDAFGPDVNRSHLVGPIIFRCGIHQLFRNHTAPLADSTLQRPQLTPALTLRGRRVRRSISPSIAAKRSPDAS